MRIHISIVFIILLSIGAFGQNKSVLIQSHLNSKSGSPIEKANLVIDNVGSCITTTDGKCFYPTLKGIGSNISIKVEHDKYVPINTIELKSYRLSNRKVDTVQVIMSLIAEREQYALAYFEKEAGIIIRKRFEDKEKMLYAQINDLVAKMNGLKESKNLAYRKLEINLVETNKQLELLQKDKLNEESIAQRLAATLSMIEGEEIPDYVSQAYNFFRQGNVEGADKALNGNAIDDQIVQAKLKKKIAKLLDESADRQLKAAIAACLFKAQLKSSLYNFKEAEIWFEKAYREDSTAINTLEKFGNFLESQNQTVKAIGLYKKCIQKLDTENTDDYLYIESKRAEYLYGMGKCFALVNNTKEALSAIFTSLLIREKLFNIKYGKNYITQYVRSLIEYALILKENHDTEKAVTLIRKSLNILDSSKNEITDEQKITLTIYNNLGIIYNDWNLDYESEEILKSAEKYYLSLNSSHQKNLKDWYAATLNNLGILCFKQKKIEEALLYYSFSKKVREELSSNNPEKYLPDLGKTLNNIGNAYFIGNHVDSSLVFHKNALAIYSKLSSENFTQFGPFLAKSYSNLGLCHSKMKDFNKAIENFNLSIKQWNVLSKLDSSKFLNHLGILYNNLGETFMNKKLTDSAMYYLEKSVSIYKYLVKKDSVKYTPFLVNVSFNLLKIIFFADKPEKNYNSLEEYNIAFNEFIKNKLLKNNNILQFNESDVELLKNQKYVEKLRSSFFYNSNLSLKIDEFEGFLAILGIEMFDNSTNNPIIDTARESKQRLIKSDKEYPDIEPMIRQMIPSSKDCCIISSCNIHDFLECATTNLILSSPDDDLSEEDVIMNNYKSVDILVKYLDKKEINSLERSLVYYISALCFLRKDSYDEAVRMIVSCLDVYYKNRISSKRIGINDYIFINCANFMLTKAAISIPTNYKIRILKKILDINRDAKVLLRNDELKLLLGQLYQTMDKKTH